jgi:hypothetical protein
VRESLKSSRQSSLVLDFGASGLLGSRSSGASELQFNDGIYAEVLLWCASQPIARRWIVQTCVWKL